MPELYAQLAANVRSNPKVRRLAREAFDGDRLRAVGAWGILLTVAVEHCPDGDLSSFSAEDLADEVGCLVEHIEAMVTCGLLGRTSGGLSVTGWAEHTGSGLTKRAAWRRQKRKQREAIADMSGGHRADIGRTVRVDIADMSGGDGNGDGNGDMDMDGNPISSVVQGVGTEPPEPKPKKARAARVRDEWPTIDDFARQHGAKLRERFPSLDGKNGRPSLRDVCERVWAHRLKMPASRRWVDPYQATCNWAEKDHARHRYAWERDQTAGTPGVSQATRSKFRRRGVEPPAEDSHGNAIKLPPGYCWDDRDENMNDRGMHWTGSAWSERPRRPPEIPPDGGSTE